MNAKPLLLKKGNLALFCSVAALCEVTEILVFLSLRMHKPFLTAALYFIILAWQYGWLRYTDSYKSFALLLLIATAVTGPFGCGICLLASIIYGNQAGIAVTPDEWIKSYFFYEEKEETEKIHERIAFGLDNLKPPHDIEPLQDILETGTVLQKQMVVVKIMRYFCSHFAPFLLRAVQDDNVAVRVQAATAMAKIERDFMTQYIALENALQHAPDPYEIRLKLAHLYDDYAHVGLIDEGSRTYFREKAITAYEACFAERKTAELRHLISRLYVRHGQYERAETLLSPAVASETLSVTSVLWYMEALFHLKKFRELRDTAIHYASVLKGSSKNLFPQEIKNVLCTWSA
jgi:hypothetical protein